VATKSVHAAARGPAAVAAPVPVTITRSDALLALDCVGIPFRTADCPVPVAVQALERLFAPVFTARRSARSPRTTKTIAVPSTVRTAAFGTNSRGRCAALAATGSGASLRNDTFTPMSGRILASS